MKVKEANKTFIGKATTYDPYTGLYRVVFDDGEYEEFDDDEMSYFRLVKTYTPRKPTTSANQITVQGYFPKEGPTSRSLFNKYYCTNGNKNIYHTEIERDFCVSFSLK